MLTTVALRCLGVHETLMLGEVEALRECGVALLAAEIAQTLVNGINVVDEVGARTEARCTVPPIALEWPLLVMYNSDVARQMVRFPEQ